MNWLLLILLKILITSEPYQQLFSDPPVIMKLVNVPIMRNKCGKLAVKSTNWLHFRNYISVLPKINSTSDPKNNIVQYKLNIILQLA